MAKVATFTRTMTADGVSIGRARTRSGEALKAWEIDLPAGSAGELTTRTSATIGEATMDSASHGITTGMTVDVFWDGGVRYGVTVGTVSGTAVPISGGSGDNLPTVSTGLTITEQVTGRVEIDGDQIQLIGMEHQLDDDTDTSQAHVQLRDSGAAEIHQLALDPNQAETWDIAGGASNPFSGNPIVEIKAANGSSSQAAVLAIVSLEDSTT